MIEELLDDASHRMDQAVDKAASDFTTVRTGRANPQILNRVVVEYYGTPTPLNQVAALSVPDPTTIAIAPWEPSVLAEVEKALLRSNLGLTPNNDGKVVRLNIPPLTEERRKDLIRVVRQEAEGARVAIRNIRRDANTDMKNMVKEKMISEDEERRGQDLVQKLTDDHIAAIDALLEEKEKDLMAI